MRDEKEERKKQANKHARQSNTAHVHVCTYIKCMAVYSGGSIVFDK